MLAAANCSGMRESRTVVSGVGSRRFGRKVEALIIIRLGFWSILHSNYNKAPPIKAPSIRASGWSQGWFWV